MSARPYLVNFLAIKTGEFLNIRCAMSVTRHLDFNIFQDDLSNFDPTSPLQSIQLLSSQEFKLKIIGLNSENKVLLTKEYESDSFGDFDLKIPLSNEQLQLHTLQIFETSYRPGLDLLTGTFLILNLPSPKKIVISDFDKTLVDTKYSTPAQMYSSLKNPLSHFPVIEQSLLQIKKLIEQGYHPFILSASPHFYEKAIRDWLYQHHIFTGNIFLKDYRKIFSIINGDLTPKDLKAHGFYKLNHLVTILLMTHIPDSLVLMGDGFESDADIYLTLRSVLVERMDPWYVWTQVKKVQAFNMNTRQDSRFLSKLYQLNSMLKNKDSMDFKISIRCTKSNYENIKTKDYKIPFLNEQRQYIEYYIA